MWRAAKRGPPTSALSGLNWRFTRASQRHDAVGGIAGDCQDQPWKPGTPLGLCPVRCGDAPALRTQCAVPDSVSASSAFLVASRYLRRMVLSHGARPARLWAVSLRTPQYRVVGAGLVRDPRIWRPASLHSSADGAPLSDDEHDDLG